MWYDGAMAKKVVPRRFHRNEPVAFRRWGKTFVGVWRRKAENPDDVYEHIIGFPKVNAYGELVMAEFYVKDKHIWRVLDVVRIVDMEIQ